MRQGEATYLSHGVYTLFVQVCGVYVCGHEPFVHMWACDREREEMGEGRGGKDEL